MSVELSVGLGYAVRGRLPHGWRITANYLGDIVQITSPDTDKFNIFVKLYQNVYAWTDTSEDVFLDDSIMTVKYESDMLRYDAVKFPEFWLEVCVKDIKEIINLQRSKALPKYNLTEGDEVAVFAATCFDPAGVTYTAVYVVPWAMMHPLIAIALTSKRQQLARPTNKQIAELNITLKDVEGNNDFFEYISAKDVADGRRDEGEEIDSDEEVEDRDEVLDQIKEWVNNKLFLFCNREIEVAVKIRGMVYIH